MEIVTRAEWGAIPARGMAEARYPMSALWIHHSDTRPTDDPAADMRLLQEIGMQRGFSDVSYTFGLHPDGTILEGRELRYVGAHTFGQNSSSLAFVLIGNYDSTPPTDAQIASARWLRDHLLEEGYLSPGTYPTGGHRDAPGNATGCPGNAAEDALPLFRLPSNPQPQPSMKELPMRFTYIALGEDFVFLTEEQFCGRLPFGDFLDEIKKRKAVEDWGEQTAEFHAGVKALADQCGFRGDRG